MPNHSGPTRTHSSASAHDIDKQIPPTALKGLSSPQRAVVKKSHTKKVRAAGKNPSEDMTEELAVVDLAVTIDKLMDEDTAAHLHNCDGAECTVCNPDFEPAPAVPELTLDQVAAINKPFNDRELAICKRIVDALDANFADGSVLTAGDLHMIMHDLHLGFVNWHFAEKPASLIAHEKNNEQTIPQ